MSDTLTLPDTGEGHGTASRLHPAERIPPSQRDPVAVRHWQNQFLPTLFDRLSDEAPHQKTEAPAAYAVSRAQLRAIVQRDLAYLLNATNQADKLDSNRHPEVVSSTINYGVPALTGGYLSERKWIEIEKLIRNAILTYEPRLLPDSLIVRPLRRPQDEDQYNMLQFEISALLYMQPYPVEFMVQSVVDLETHHIAIRQL